MIYSDLLGLSQHDRENMLSELGMDSEEDLFDVIPTRYRLSGKLDLPAACPEWELRRVMTGFANQNSHAFKNDVYLGAGCYDHHVPAVIDSIASRGEFLTAYTPYQPEMSQGLLTALHNFTKKIEALVDLPVVTSSHYDGATALAEACWMAVCYKKKNTILVSPALFPQYRSVLDTYCWGRDIKLVSLECDSTSGKTIITKDSLQDIAAVVVQSPNQYGIKEDFQSFADLAEKLGSLLIGVTHPYLLPMMKPLGQIGFDIIILEGQPLGLHMNAGGAHLGILACKEELRHLTPGRLIGKVSDINGEPAFALVFEDREQHVARHRATSNICSNQALNAIRAGAFLSLYGAKGIAGLGHACNNTAKAMKAAMLKIPGVALPYNGNIFQEFVVSFKSKKVRISIQEKLSSQGILAGINNKQHKGLEPNQILISFTETKSFEQLKKFITAICKALSYDPTEPLDCLSESIFKNSKLKPEPIFTHPDLQPCSEISLIRKYTAYSRNNFGVDTGSYPLGSCTMKYNPKRNDLLAETDGFQALHPLQPIDTLKGLREIYTELQGYIATIIGMDFVDLTPAAGAHGELKGLMIARRHFEDNDEFERNEVIIPDSAHGTNPASASMVGYKCRIIPTRPDGLMDVDSLCKVLSSKTAVVMTTNPSTFGLFEREIEQIVDSVHAAGALLYYDGANMNALMGHTTPGAMGFDIAHINVHKTLSTPHGGGGPGAGPIGVKSFLKTYISNGFNNCSFDYGPLQTKLYFGHISVLLRAYAYIRSMGSDGLKKASSDAVLNANYLMHRLNKVLPAVFGRKCMHEALLTGNNLPISTLDLSKRMIDFKIHPPTLVGAGCVYFGEELSNAMLFEPTESESKKELDYIADTIIKIIDEATKDVSIAKSAPYDTPVARLNFN